MNGTSGKRAGFRVLLTLAVLGSAAVVVTPVLSILLKQDDSFSRRFHRSLVDSDSDNFNDELEQELAESSFLFRPLFPIRVLDFVGFVAAILGLMMAAGGGVGGGGFLVPIYILIMGFPVKHAVSLSNVTVFGGSIANILLNFPKRHPSSVVNRPLIDWNLMALMEPLTMAGALIGAELNAYLPDIVLVLLLVFLLGFTTFRTLEKANKLHAVESRSAEEDCIAAVASKKDEQALLEPVLKSPSSSSPSIALSYGTQGDVENTEETTKICSKELAILLEKESRVPWVRIAELSGLFLAVIGLNLLKGSGDRLAWLLPFEVACGSPAFYWLGAANLVLILGFALCVRYELIRDTERKQALNFEFARGDIQWNSSNTLVYSSISSLAGLFAGMFGIGGGIVKSPLMLEMGVHPAVASATSATMILFTSFTATTSYIVHGALNFQYAIVCVVLGFISTVVGQVLMDVLMAKYNRYSYIAYSVSFVVGISAVAMTVQSVVAIAQGRSQKGVVMCSFTDE